MSKLFRVKPISELFKESEESEKGLKRTLTAWSMVALGFGAIIGAGARKGASAVKWGVTTRIFWAWILTIPVSAAISFSVYLFLNLILN